MQHNNQHAKLFKRGLKRLRMEQQTRISHLEMVVKQLIAQRAIITDQLAKVRQEAIDKLDGIRKNYSISMAFEQETNDNNSNHGNNNNHSKRNKNKNHHNNVTTGGGDVLSNSSSDSDVVGGSLNEYENEYDNLAPLSMVELMHKREKFG